MMVFHDVTLNGRRRSYSKIVGISASHVIRTEASYPPFAWEDFIDGQWAQASQGTDHNNNWHLLGLTDSNAKPPW
ncbi:hypothetical protein AND_002608 [Anopheles darlingi]|uniref:Uncharacterized protein n=1 Tax=Anopheles darlingi TaxID=43151 RepID=W5JRR6_ANODA|nr:hypothetical protein AND_002608 [Anopheles darlingi]